jgi:predicted ABC-type transport system involved in lysophospholipase L1 biosynthesis ATPase subunit
MSDADTPILKARGVHRDFALLRNRIEVLRGVDLDVPRGQTLSIMGASGAGKSTLLHILGGLDRPTQGSVYYAGQDLFRLSARRRTELRSGTFGFVFQAYHLLPELTVAENVVLPMMRRGDWLHQTHAYRRRALDLLAQVGLQDRAGHRPMELSGGEQQRAALARALVGDPQVVLADEPTGNLDSRTGETVLEQLFGLTRERGQTLVLVTHNDAVADRCDRVVHMLDGRLTDANADAPVAETP